MGLNVNQQFLQPTQQTKELGLIQHMMTTFGLSTQQRFQMLNGLKIDILSQGQNIL